MLGVSDFTLRVQGRIKGTFYTHHHQSAMLKLTQHTVTGKGHHIHMPH